jgi:hypothetical protein
MAEPNNAGLTWKIIDAIAKIGIPIAIAFFAYMQHCTSQKYQESQDKMSTKIKLLDIAFTSLSGQEEKKKSVALKIIRQLDEDFAIQIEAVVLQDTSQSKEIQNQAAESLVKALSPKLSGYKIDIYQLENNPKAYTIGQKIKSEITSRKITDKVILQPEKKEFFEEKWKGTGVSSISNEVRYEPSRDGDAAHALTALLKKICPDLEFPMRPYMMKHPSGLSIFIWVDDTTKDNQCS